ncbi:hypothetical protein TNCV_2078541 [Trichonephila clavipes]|nr:hypothetical protein TNCV_2078541 [Trichonephila clavipes]
MSHVEIISNEIEDSLAKAASSDALLPHLPSTLSEVFSDTMKKERDLWRVSPKHIWYSKNTPGDALLFEGYRSQQTCISRFASMDT